MLGPLEFMDGSTHRTYMDSRIQTNGLLILERETKVVKFWVLEDKVDWDELKGKN